MILTHLNLEESPQKIEILEDIEFKTIYIGQKDDVLKKKIQFIHRRPGIKSRITIKAVVFENANFDIESTVIIEKGAFATDTYLKVDCLVIGDNAFARAIPSLEIKESDVKGGHGATIGYIDQQQLNYIYSRGLDFNIAQKLIIDAFINN